MIMNYAYVENDEVIKIEECPKSFGNISGFNNATDAVKISNGWYPLIDNKPLLKDYEQLTSVEYTINESDVTADYVVTSLSLAVYKKARINELKNYISQIINDTYPEYKQRSAALGIYPQAAIDEIKAFIEAKITYCDTKEASINAATTLNGVSLITWGDE